MKKLFLPLGLFFSLGASAQLFIDNATFFIDNGAVVTVQGDITSNVDIQAAGTGKIRLGGTAAQNVNMGGKIIPTLQVDNATGPITLTSNAKIATSLEFTTGKVVLGNFDLILASTAAHTGAGAGKFAETNGTGVVKKELTAATPGTILPVGNGSNYNPVNYTTTGGTYNASTFVSARSIGAEHPNKHPRSTDFLKSYWKLNNNIAGATITTVGTFVNPAGVTGDVALVKAMVYNGTTWTLGTTQAATSVTAPAAANAPQDLYGMNKFILVSPKAFLEGSFDQATGLLKDGLRVSGQIPGTDPYRTTVGFTHLDNNVVESIAPGVLANQASAENNIVDWVYLELRDNATPTVVQQTRAALIQRDGDIVDIDGISPIYFKNKIDGSYNLFVRHRNHLGVRSNTTIAMGMSTIAKNFTASAASAYVDAAVLTNPPMKELTVTAAPNAFTMFASNANADSKSTKIGAAAINDYSILLAGINIAFGYYKADYNLDGKVLKTGPAAINDYSKLLGTLNGLNTVSQHNK